MECFKGAQKVCPLCSEVKLRLVVGLAGSKAEECRVPMPHAVHEGSWELTNRRREVGGNGKGGGIWHHD